MITTKENSKRWQENGRTQKEMLEKQRKTA
jgi:hypothetical protein